MLELKNRQLLILNAIITSDSHTSCKSLAALAKVSERTVKSDVVILKEYVLGCGCLIKSQKGYGYYIEITDREVYRLKRREMTIWFSNVEYLKSDTTTRVNELCRMMIVQMGYIKLDDLAEKIHMSRSSIKADLKEAKIYLERANLMVKVLPGSGIKVEGRELSRRLCMLELYEVHYHEPIHMRSSANREYLQFFSCSEEMRSAIRHNFLKTIRESVNSINDKFGNRIVTYLVLMRNRIDQGYHIKLNSSEIKLLQSFSEYHLALRIIENLNTISNYAVSDEEIISLEMLILIWNDLSPVKDLKAMYSPFYGEATKLVRLIGNRVLSMWHIDVFKMDHFESELRAYLIPILIQLRFNCCQYEITGLQVHGNSIKNSPLSLNIAKAMAEVINEKFGCRLSVNNVNNIAVAVYASLERIQLKHTPLRLLICSENGYTGADILKRRILSSFSEKFFSRVDSMKFYEVRGIDPSKYDYLLLNHSAYSYRYDIPFIPVQQTPTKAQLEEIYSKIILSGYHLDRVLADYGFNKHWAYHNFGYTSKEEFVRLLSYRIGNGDDEVAKISQALTSCHDTQICNGVLTMLMNTELIKKNIFEVYLLGKSSIWEKRSLEYIVFMSVDFQCRPQGVKFIELLLASLTRHPDMIKSISEEDGFTNLLQLVAQEL